MFSDKISLFKTFDSDPVTTELSRWVHATMKRNNKFADKVLEYRKTGADHLKRGLPLATVGAVCENGRKLSNVETRTGWIALDVDAKDNPHLNDAEAVRDAIANIIYVAFAGLSVSGKGVWALVKVEDPQKQPKYFEQLKKDFRKRGIILDITKGKNPNDARFYSYDPDAVINKTFQVYDRLSKEKSTLGIPKSTYNDYKSAGNISSDHSDKYGQAAFEDELQTLSRTANGNRNNQLFKSTAALAQLVAGGILNKKEVADALYGTAESIGLQKHEIESTISSGFRAGMKNPRQPAETTHTKLLTKKDSSSNGEYEADNSASYGFNTWTGEIFDERGYPSSWDEV